jgi:hypothetical protein
VVVQAVDKDLKPLAVAAVVLVQLEVTGRLFSLDLFKNRLIFHLALVLPRRVSVPALKTQHFQ